MVQTNPTAKTLIEKTTPRQLPMTLQDATINLVRARDLHEGTWRLYVKFGQALGTNIRVQGRDWPAGILPIVEVGLVRELDGEETTLGVDAAVVNPKGLVQ